MAWFCEILGKNDEVLEKSELIYASQFEAQMAGYRRTSLHAEARTPGNVRPFPPAPETRSTAINRSIVNRFGRGDRLGQLPITGASSTGRCNTICYKSFL